MTKWLSHRMVERGIIKEEEQELYQLSMGAVSQPDTRIRRESSWQKQQKRSA